MTERGTTVLKTALLVAGGVALGAGLMYILDPASGRNRRQWVGGKATGIAKKTGRVIADGAVSLRNRAMSLTHHSGDHTGANASI